MPRGSRKNADSVLVAALASGSTVEDAARLADVNPSTVWRRKRDPDFVSLVAQARAEMTSRALGRLADGMTEAADCLRALLTARSDMARLGAARALIELGVKLRESIELEARITALEQGQKGTA